MSDDLELCGHRAEDLHPDYEACPLEADHEGEHLIWRQDPYETADGEGWRINVWTAAGEPEASSSFRSPATPLEVCALVALIYALRDRLSDPDEA